MRRIGGRLTNVTARSGRMQTDGRSTGFDDGRAQSSAEALVMAMRRAGSELSEPPDDLTVSRMAAVAALNRRAVAGIDDAATIPSIGRPVDGGREDRTGPHWRWVGAVAAVLIVLVVGLNLLMPALPPTMTTTGGDGVGSTPSPIGPASTALYEPDGIDSPAPVDENRIRGRVAEQTPAPSPAAEPPIGRSEGDPAPDAGPSPATTSTVAPTDASTQPSTALSTLPSTEPSTVASAPPSTVSSTVSSTTAPASPNGSPGQAGAIPASGNESSSGVPPEHGFDAEGDLGGGSLDWPGAMAAGGSGDGFGQEALVQTYPLGEAGAITVSFFAGRLQLVSVDACDTCIVDRDVDTDTELVVRISARSVETTFAAEASGSNGIVIDIRFDASVGRAGTTATYPLGEAGEVSVEFGLDQVTVVGVVEESGWWQSSAHTVWGRTDIEFRNAHGGTARLEAVHRSGGLHLIIAIDVSP